MMRLPTPYGWRETLGLLGRMALGPTTASPAELSCLPHRVQLSSVQPRARLAFVGDIMAMSASLWGRRHSLRTTLYPLVIEDEVRDFVRDCDALVGNFEGALADKKQFFIDQAHHPSIMVALAELFDPRRTYLSVANNHSGDFGRGAFDRTVGALEDAGFTVFGSAACPAVSPTPGVRLVGGTMWVNRPCDFVARLADVMGGAEPESANVLFPHWGYELEAFPRSEIVRLAAQLAGSFDAIVGHHSHTPQPIVALAVDAERVCPVAYSLGNFCFAVATAAYRHGEIVVMELGTTPLGRWAVGTIRWSFLAADHRAREVRVRLCDSVPQLAFGCTEPRAGG